MTMDKAIKNTGTLTNKETRKLDMLGQLIMLRPLWSFNLL